MITRARIIAVGVVCVALFAALLERAAAQNTEESPYDYQLSAISYPSSDTEHHRNAYREAIEEIGPGGHARIAYTILFRPNAPLQVYDNAGVAAIYTHCGSGPPPSGDLSLTAISAPYEDSHGWTRVFLSPEDGLTRAYCYEPGDVWVGADYGFTMTITGCFRLERRWVPTLELISFFPVDPALCDD